ncbi:MULTISPECIES: SAM-dependent DNA methyltransferase [unclassified Mesorhizobium]|uniref:SAM-dependent DNA methyltransferase n=2 Tax=Mesorhizobium TaxID=68287 RepID=UPI0019D4AA3F|nr:MULTISPECIES: SAM-dependent DNA methyltransferase [unclassified Mesorhizobium]
MLESVGHSRTPASSLLWQEFIVQAVSPDIPKRTEPRHPSRIGATFRFGRGGLHGIVSVLSLLFIRYISDKYADLPYAPITVPKGASFADIVALKGTPDIGDLINKKIIAPLAAANQQLSQADFPDFNEASKLGDGKEIAMWILGVESAG